MKEKIVVVLKFLYKCIPLIITALGGGAIAATVAGCKVGSLVSLSTPM